MKEDHRSNKVSELISKTLLNAERKKKIFVRLKKNKNSSKIFGASKIRNFDQLLYICPLHSSGGRWECLSFEDHKRMLMSRRMQWENKKIPISSSFSSTGPRKGRSGSQQKKYQKGKIMMIWGNWDTHITIKANQRVECPRNHRKKG